MMLIANTANVDRGCGGNSKKIVLDFGGGLKYNSLSIMEEGQIRGLCYGTP